MTLRHRFQMLLLASTFACAVAVQAAAPATVPTPVTAPAAAPPSPPLVSLPDFTALVDRTGPAVVNIEASSGNQRNEEEALGERDEGRTPFDDEGQGDENAEEFFRRFFGQPGRPRAPRGGTSYGTGFIISADGYVLTNHHVIEGTDEVIVRLTDRRELSARVIGSDPLSDVALLKVEATGLPVLKIGDSRSLKPGQWVLAIGSPFGFDHSVTAGIVSGVGRRSLDPNQQYVPFIQTDVAINRGNSGGPLLNTRGEVVGINSQIFSNSGGYMGVSFAIPIEVAMNAVRQLRETGRVTRGQLGVQIQDVDRELARSMGMARPGGALVSAIVPGSAAARAGIQAGDVITAFNGREIGRSAELPPLVGAMPPGSRASVRVLRDGRSLDLVVELMALGGSQAATDPTVERELPGNNPLGIVVEEIDARTRSQLGLAAGEGVRVSRVAGVAARRAGLSAGDVILMVGKTRVGSVAQFQSALQGVRSGDSVRLLVNNGQSTGFIAISVR